MRFRAKHNFKADTNDNLDLTVGDIIRFEKNDTEKKIGDRWRSSDWWYGTKLSNGSKGWFPKNYTELLFLESNTTKDERDELVRKLSCCCNDSNKEKYLKNLLANIGECQICWGSGKMYCRDEDGNICSGRVYLGGWNEKSKSHYRCRGTGEVTCNGYNCQSKHNDLPKYKKNTQYFVKY